MSTSPQSADRIAVVGTSHRSSTLPFREGLRLDEASIPRVLDQLRAAGCSEVLLLATPERIEVVAAHDRPDHAVDAIRTVLMERADLDPKEPAAQFHAFRGPEAVHHLFHIAAGLESVVPGDPQAAADLRAAREISRRHGTFGSALDALVSAALNSADVIGRETGLASRPDSIAAAVIELARDIQGDLSRASALLFGPGELGERLIETLLGAGLGQAVLTGRSVTRLERMARHLKCPMVPIEALDESLAAADIVIAAQGSSPPPLTVEKIESALKRRRRRPILVIDAAIPGDVERRVNELDGAFLYDIGDLERFVMERGVARVETAAGASDLADRAAQAFLEEGGLRDGGQAAPVSGAAPDAGLRQRLEELRQAALKEGADAAGATKLLIERLAAEMKNLRRGGKG